MSFVFYIRLIYYRRKICGGKHILFMKSIYFLLLGLIQLSAFAQKPMLCARIEGLWHFYDTNGKEMFEANTVRATLPQGWVNGCVSVLQVTNAMPDSSQSIVPVFSRVLLDTKGKVVFEPKVTVPYRIITPVDAAGYALLTNMETGEFMLCDKTGEVVDFPSNATNINYKKEGLIEFVAKEDSVNEDVSPFKTLYDMKQKKALFRGKWEFLGDFHNGIAFINDTLHRLGAINRKGEILVPTRYKCPLDDEYMFMTEIETEYFILMDSSDEYVIFNKNGKQLGDKSFAQQPVISSNFISVWDDEKEWYIIDNKGNIVAPHLWKNNQNTEGFNALGIAAISQDELYAIINPKGEQIVGFDKGYKYALTSPSSIFLSKDEEEWDVFNAKGKIIRSISAVSMLPFGNNHYTQFSLQEQNGLMSDDGKVVIPLGNYAFSTICDDFFETKETVGDNIIYQYWNPLGKMVLKNPIQDMGADWIIPVQPEAKCYVPF